MRGKASAWAYRRVAVLEYIKAHEPTYDNDPWKAEEIVDELADRFDSSRRERIRKEKERSK
jgi:pyrroloquinoline quinone (PQQ) biosynthesis protein C